MDNQAVPFELTILMPCLNEAETIAVCIRKAKTFLAETGIKGEILIADNGSSDGSQDIAKGLGVRVVQIKERGYGSALLGGINAAQGKYIIMGDADDSYDFSQLHEFFEKLRSGCDLVMGNRFEGGIKPGAMPFLHQYLGNPVLSFIGRLFFQSPVGDFHCGLRGFKKEAIEKLNLRTTGMEFASEMIVKASLFGYCITEVPTTLSPAGRSRAPHLRTWQDGWRHLRFLLLYSPRWLFLYPGISLAVVGTMISAALLPGPVTISGTTFDIHTLLYSSMSVVLGFQLILFAMFTKIFAISEGLLPEDPRLDRMFEYIRLEAGLLGGAVLFGLGAVLSILAYLRWSQEGFGDLDPGRTFRIVIPAVLLIILGVQTIFSSFFLSVLGLKRQN
ncbi:MAG: glycosyltransferase family 2 protein [Anaerolineales bacterium]|jgi:glycosyltransferase involved in cell wall biosynthesis